MTQFEDDFGEFLGNASVTVQTYMGDGAQGAVFGDAETITSGLMVEDITKVVRSATGDEVLSTTTIYLNPPLVGKFKPGSKVGLPSGRVAVVIDVGRLDVYGFPAHGVVHLT